MKPEAWAPILEAARKGTVTLLYCGTYRLFHDVFQPMGFAGSFMHMSDPASIGAAITSKTRRIWIETPMEYDGHNPASAPQPW